MPWTGIESSGSFQGRAQSTGRSLEDVTADAFGIEALARFVDPDDIAASAFLLASEHGKSITGQTIPIDGGSKSAE